jgi:hypothetical protein
MSCGIAQWQTTLGGLEKMTPEVGKLVNLRVLKLVNNTRLGSLPESISCLRKLEVLHLEECPVSALPEGFGTLANLQTLCVKRSRTLGFCFPPDLKVTCFGHSAAFTVRQMKRRVSMKETLKRCSDIGLSDEHLSVGRGDIEPF